MLSIVKMDFDSDTDVLDEDIIKSEVIDIVEEETDNQGTVNNIARSLELVPVVYTTRLDEMAVLKSDPDQIYPKEATTRIIKESKPVLRIIPTSPRRGRLDKKRFGEMKVILKRIFCSPKKIHNNDETDMKPDVSNIQIDLSSVKSEVIEEPSFEKTGLNDKCKYSELLKLCRPCSVIIGPRVEVIHGGKVLRAIKVHKPRLSLGQSTDDEEPLITYPNLLATRNICNTTEENESKENKRKNTSTELKKSAKRPKKIIPVNTLNTTIEATDLSQIPQRLMRNGVLQIHDTFSKEYHLYFTDSESNLLDYYKDTDDNALIHEKTDFQVDSRYTVNNCCWVKKDESLQALYPKLLIYSNTRFMRTAHPCKPGACVCCCRKKGNIKKPNLVFTDDKLLPLASANKTVLKNDKEMRDFEDEIDKSIININRTPKMNSNEWLRDLLTRKRGTYSKISKANTYIGKALAYKKQLPQKPTENRRLVTLQKGDSQNTVIILRNFAMDVIEIYVFNVDSDLETYIKTNCYNNTSQPDVRKLLNKPNAINELVCCWFKREEVIAKLHNAKDLHPTAVKFIRTNHACLSKECNCCCRPVIKKEVTLTDIKLPSRKTWSAALKSFKPTIEAESQPRDCQYTPSPSPKNVISAKLLPKTVSAAAQVQHKQPPPLVSILPSKPSTSQNESDCKITSIITSPTLQVLPQNPTVPVTVATVPLAVPTVLPGLIVTDVVNSDELSKEVNSLITSILERFKDVRLTINSDGKVAAALNTPVSTLSTVELKVLANILSYAQSQINLLGFKANSAMSLSNIINLKVDDQQNSTLDPNSVYKAFGKNVNINTNAQEEPLQSTNVNNMLPVFSLAPALPTIPQTYTYFTNSMSVRNQHFNDAFSSFINSKTDPVPTETFAPVIENVFTLKEETETEPSSSTVWYRKPAAQQTSVSDLSEITSNENKRKDMETQTLKSNKLRVLSPSKLGVATSKSEGITRMATLTQQNLPVGNLVPGVGLEPNNNFQVRSLGGAQTQTIVNGGLSTSHSQPMLIINPINTPSLINTGATVSVPFTNSIINTGNAFNISNPQMPIIINASSISHLATTGGSYVSMTQGVNTLQTPVATAVEVTTASTAQDNNPEEYSADDPDVDYSVDNDVEMDYSVDNEAEADFSIDNATEEKYCIDNEDEEDCILGF